MRRRVTITYLFDLKMQPNPFIKMYGSFKLSLHIAKRGRKVGKERIKVLFLVTVSANSFPEKFQSWGGSQGKTMSVNFEITKAMFLAIGCCL